MKLPPVNLQPASVRIACNDAASDCHVECHDFSRERVHLEFVRGKQKIAGFAFTKDQARSLAAWLIDRI